MQKSRSSVSRVELGAVSTAQPHLPELDGVAAKIVRGLGQALVQAGCSTDVTAGEIKSQSFAEWKATLSPALAAARYRDPAVKGGMLLTVPAPLIATLVDMFYGGSGAIDQARTSLGMAEQRLFDRLAGQIGEVLAAAWADIEKLTPVVVATVFSPQDIRFCKPGDIVVVQTFAVCDEKAGKGAIEIVYPLAGLRGLTGLRALPVSGGDEVDSAWQSRLSDAVMHARLPVRTVIARPSVPLSRLVNLMPGDFIPLTLPARVPVTVAGCLLGHGTIGQANGRAAIKIDRLEQGALLND